MEKVVNINPLHSAPLKFDGTNELINIFEHLSSRYGFQDGNVKNQCDHLLLLLANRQARMNNRAGVDGVVNEVFEKTMSNYQEWCKYIKAKRAWFKELDWQQKMLLISLYLLIWGEAANLRFMPECLCYIFHKLSDDALKRIPLNEEPIKSESNSMAFLEEVVVRIYEVVAEEAKNHAEALKSTKTLNHRAVSHATWRNYDDWNEYFWSSSCLTDSEQVWSSAITKFLKRIDSGSGGGPTAATTSNTLNTLQSTSDYSGSVNSGTSTSAKPFIMKSSWDQRKVMFVEHRTFLHIYHSFHRLWMFKVLMLQGLAILAFEENLRFDTLKKLLSLGPTFVVMRFIQSSLDALGLWGAFKGTPRLFLLRILIQFIFFGAFSGVLIFIYVKVLQESSSVGISDSYYLKVYMSLLGLFTILFGLQMCTSPCSWRFIDCIKEQYYVGRNMQERLCIVIRYTLFWAVLLSAKFTFSYFLQIKPLVEPTKAIVQIRDISYVWHDFVSKNNHNALTVASLWVPVVLVYLLDTQIWYIVCSALLGFLNGAMDHLGEIRSLPLFLEKFNELPEAFVDRMIVGSSSSSSSGSSSKGDRAAHYFATYWNELIKKLRLEDYLSDEEMDLLLMPEEREARKDEDRSKIIQWPLFFLLNKVRLAKSLATKNENIVKEIKGDDYMLLAVKEIYDGVKWCLEKLMGMKWDSLDDAFQKVEGWKKFKFEKLPGLIDRVEVLVKKLADVAAAPETSNQLLPPAKELYGYFVTEFRKKKGEIDWEKFQVGAAWPSGLNDAEKDFVRRLKKLLLAEESALDVPRNLEARRRLLFFGNSLLMRMPRAPSVKEMLSFSVLTPHYDEEVLYSLKYLRERNKDGITNLFYLQQVFSDEWKFFLERNNVKEGEMEKKLAQQENEEQEKRQQKQKQKEPVFESFEAFIKNLGVEHKQTKEKEKNKRDKLLMRLRLWASYRGQTLARTVRGMMYYRDALVFQHNCEKTVPGPGADVENPMDAESLADMKFTYVVSCQKYGDMKRSKDSKAEDIDYLMRRYPQALRIAYIDKENETYHSKLIKYENGNDWKETERLPLCKDHGGSEDPGTSQVECWRCKVKEVYSIKLPGDFLIGEGKPENQNHAIIFTRGDAVQTIDMNQDNYFEEALKMRNLLEEFKIEKEKQKQPTILGIREHIFTGSVSSLAWFMSNQESSFVTLGQRVMAHPLKVRMHYGHPDVFDRLFHITRGGLSKASKTINLSEDIFAGFNTTLRGGSVTHHEYMQVGKGRDLGLNQISTFEAKVSSGNGEQLLSRDVYRLGRLFGFFRMLSFYYTSVGYYVATMLTVWALYAFLYGKAYLALSGVEDDLLHHADVKHNIALQNALSTEFLFQIGVFNCVPMIMGYILEQGAVTAVLTFLNMQLLFSSVFFVFSLGTRSHYFGRTILHGGAKYRKTGRGFVIEHVPFAENYRMYSRSHFVRGLEIVMLLLVYRAYGSEKGLGFVLMSINNWFLALSWIYAPFLFNPLGFEWPKTSSDLVNWNTWLLNPSAGAKEDESWSTWWEEQHQIRTVRSMILETVLSLRFFMIQYGVVYRLKESGGSDSLLVYAVSWVLFIGVFFMIVFLSVSTKGSNKLRLFHALAVLLMLAAAVVGAIFLLRLTISDVFASALAILPTGWGLLSIAVALKPVLETWNWLWWSVRAWAQWYDGMMGYVIFAPIIFFSWFPFISPLQTRILFNQEFSRGLEVSVLLSGRNTAKFVTE